MTELLIKLFLKTNGEEAQQRHKYGVMAGVVGICCNLLLTVFKISTGLLTGAVSIVSDAVNNLSDAVSSIVTMVGFKVSGKPADREHPYGHGRVEYLTGFIIAAAVIAVALNFLKESVRNILHPGRLDVSVVTIIILAVSILIKLWMSVFYTKIANRISSEAMRATAADSRSDCITTGVALLSAIVMLLFKVNIDGYAGAVVSVVVMISGFMAARETIEPLLGKAPDQELIRSIEKEALSHEEILGIHDIRIHEYGHDISIASAHVEVPYTLTLVKAHEVIDEIEEALVKRGCVTEVTFHIDPVMIDDEEMMKLRRELTEYLQGIDTRISIHDFRMIHGELKDDLIFEILVPYDVKKTDQELREMLLDRLGKENKTYSMKLTIDRE